MKEQELNSSAQKQQDKTLKITVYYQQCPLSEQIAC